MAYFTYFLKSTVLIRQKYFANSVYTTYSQMQPRHSHPPINFATLVRFSYINFMAQIFEGCGFFYAILVYVNVITIYQICHDLKPMTLTSLVCLYSFSFCTCWRIMQQHNCSIRREPSFCGFNVHLLHRWYRFPLSDPLDVPGVVVYFFSIFATKNSVFVFIQ